MSVSILIVTDIIDVNPDFSFRTGQYQTEIKRDEKYMINQPGCRISSLKPFDPSIETYVNKPQPVDCRNDSAYPIFTAKRNRNHIVLLEDAMRAQNYYFNETACCYRAFSRREPKGNERDTQIRVSGECNGFELIDGEWITPKINTDFIQVECEHNGTVFHKDYYSFIPESKVINKTYFDSEMSNNKLNTTNSQDYLSVLMLGIDAVSRMNLYRQLPKSVNYLLQNLSANEMIGYNKIGDNTFPNLMAVLTGQTTMEVEQGCLAHTKNERFDDCDLVWKDFNSKGYVSVFAEDSTGMGLFNYFRSGFKQLTTDYDYRAFDAYVNHQVGNKHTGNSNICLGGRIRANLLLNYTREFAETFAKRPYFGLFWSVSISHDYLNMPHLLDDEYFNFFSQLSETNQFNNTALIFMSDHGIRWGGIRTTYQGRLEERLPFLFFIMPKWFREKYSLAWQNLRINTNRLTTPFDLHQTLIDLSDLDTLTNENLAKRIEEMSRQHLPRGISLFLPVFPGRTCEHAEIDEHWCTCQRFEQIDSALPIVKTISEFVVQNVNKNLVGYAQCATLTLKDIQSASMADVTHLKDKKENIKIIEEYTIVLTTTPGDAIFEATVRVNAKDSFQMAGPISRLNLYGTQSRCITDFHLKLYCFCN